MSDMPNRDKLARALERAMVRGGTPAGEATMMAEQLVTDPAAMARLAEGMMVLAELAGATGSLEDRRS